MSHAFDHGNGHKNKPVTIIVNARPKQFDGERISYEEVVNLAFLGQVDSNILYTVTYQGPHVPDGTLAEGQSVAIRNGMKFDVIKTNRS